MLHNRSVARAARGSLAAAGLMAAAVAGHVATSTVAMAQDCKLSVRATPNVLYAGQSANVDALAYFPTSMYAFAGAAFDMHSTHPTWSYASSGALVPFGADVLGINVGQAHSPQTGIYADPANPIRVWRGVFSPTSTAPAFVEISADPTNFSVYPNRLTPSWVGCNALGGSDFVFVNPFGVGRWVAAPGPRTSVSIGSGSDILIGGSTNYDNAVQAPIVLGLLVPAVQRAPRSSEVRVAFDGQPESFAATVQVQDAQRSTIRTVAISFDAQSNGGVWKYNTTVGNRNGAPLAATFEAYHGGVRVAVGDLDALAPNGESTLQVASTPDVIITGVGTGGGPHVRAHDDQIPSSAVTWTFHYNEPVAAIVRGHNTTQKLTIDSFAVSTPIAVTGPRPLTVSTVEQFGLATHVFESTRARGMILMPRSPAE